MFKINIRTFIYVFTFFIRTVIYYCAKQLLANVFVLLLLFLFTLLFRQYFLFSCYVFVLLSLISDIAFNMYIAQLSIGFPIFNFRLLLFKKQW